MADTEPDEILKLMVELLEEGKPALASFNKRLADKAFTDPNDLARAVSDLFALTLDLATLTSTAHTEHFDWAGGVDEELDAIRDGLPPVSALLPTDAANLKELVQALLENLRAPKDANDALPGLLAIRAAEALVFIEQITAEAGDDDDDEEGDEDEDEDKS